MERFITAGIRIGPTPASKREAIYQMVGATVQYTELERLNLGSE
jgi:hypothetical protein